MTGKGAVIFGPIVLSFLSFPIGSSRSSAIISKFGIGLKGLVGAGEGEGDFAGSVRPLGGDLTCGEKELKNVGPAGLAIGVCVWHSSLTSSLTSTGKSQSDRKQIQTIADMTSGRTTSIMHTVNEGEESHRTVSAKIPARMAGIPTTAILT